METIFNKVMIIIAVIMIVVASVMIVKHHTNEDNKNEEAPIVTESQSYDTLYSFNIGGQEYELAVLKINGYELEKVSETSFYITKKGERMTPTPINFISEDPPYIEKLKSGAHGYHKIPDRQGITIETYSGVKGKVGYDKNCMIIKFNGKPYSAYFEGDVSLAILQEIAYALNNP